jgi:hypothetical protein
MRQHFQSVKDLLNAAAVGLTIGAYVPLLGGIAATILLVCCLIERRTDRA